MAVPKSANYFTCQFFCFCFTKKNMWNSHTILGWLNLKGILHPIWPNYMSVVQSLSHIQLFATPWTTACQASLSFTISRVCSNSCPLNQWCYPTISSSVIPFSCFQSPSIRVFSNESAPHISPSNEYSELISFRIDWLDLLTVQGTLTSPLQHHSSKALLLQRSAFFMV